MRRSRWEHIFMTDQMTKLLEKLYLKPVRGRTHKEKWHLGNGHKSYCKKRHNHMNKIPSIYILEKSRTSWVYVRDTSYRVSTYAVVFHSSLQVLQNVSPNGIYLFQYTLDADRQ